MHHMFYAYIWKVANMVRNIPTRCPDILHEPQFKTPLFRKPFFDICCTWKLLSISAATVRRTPLANPGLSAVPLWEGVRAPVLVNQRCDCGAPSPPKLPGCEGAPPLRSHGGRTRPPGHSSSPREFCRVSQHDHEHLGIRIYDDI